MRKGGWWWYLLTEYGENLHGMRAPEKKSSCQLQLHGAQNQPSGQYCNGKQNKSRDLKSGRFEACCLRFGGPGTCRDIDSCGNPHKGAERAPPALLLRPCIRLRLRLPSISIPSASISGLSVMRSPLFLACLALCVAAVVAAEGEPKQSTWFREHLAPARATLSQSRYYGEVSSSE